MGSTSFSEQFLYGQSQISEVKGEAMATESGLRYLTRALASKAAQLSKEIDGIPRYEDRQEIVGVYNSLCVVLDYLNNELKTEPLINGVSGPIHKNWNKK